MTGTHTQCLVAIKDVVGGCQLVCSFGKLSQKQIIFSTQEGPSANFSGTPLYCPPEFHANGRFNGKLLDYWALGVVLYATLKGQLPFCNGKEIQEFHKESTLALIDMDLSLECELVIKNLLANEEIRSNKQNIHDVVFAWTKVKLTSDMS